MHTRALADFLVQTAVAAHQVGVEFTGVYRENTVRLTAGDESVYPDASFILVAPDQATYRYFLEIDCGTERVRSATGDQSWERKARVYDRVQDQWNGSRFRVLVVTVRDAKARLSHILETAGRVQHNPDRTLFYGLALYDYLASGSSVTFPIFSDYRGRRHPLVSAVPLPTGPTPHSLLLTPAE
jgi:hypothetical protein